MITMTYMGNGVIVPSQPMFSKPVVKYSRPVNSLRWIVTTDEFAGQWANRLMRRAGRKVLGDVLDCFVPQSVKTKVSWWAHPKAKAYAAKTAFYSDFFKKWRSGKRFNMGDIIRKGAINRRIAESLWDLED